MNDALPQAWQSERDATAGHEPDRRPTGASDALLTEHRCLACGTAAEPGWAYCGDCGAALDATALPQSPSGDPALDSEESFLTLPIPVILIDTVQPKAAMGDVEQTPRRRRWRFLVRVVLISFAVLLFVAVAAAAGYVQKETSDKLATARTQLSAT